MNQNSHFRAQKSKIFHPTPPLGASILVPTAFYARTFGARPPISNINRRHCTIFTTCRRLLGAFVPRPPPGLHRWTRGGGDFSPQTHNLPTAEKILRAHMVVRTGRCAGPGGGTSWCVTLLGILLRLLVALFNLFKVELEQPVAAPAQSQDRHKQSATAPLPSSHGKRASLSPGVHNFF